MDTINGFEVFEDFIPGAIEKNNRESNNDIPGDISAELTDEELEQIRGSQKPVDDEPIVDDELKVEVKGKQKKVKEDTPDNDDTLDDTEDDDDADDDLPETGADDAVIGFFDAISEKLGWDDVEEDEKPKTPEELVEYFQTVIEENSVPQYSSEEVEKLDNFVKNGGKLKDYFQIDAELDLDTLDVENESNQKMVVKEFLKEKGFSAKQIERRLTNYEEAGLLEDEATDALESLKEIRETKKQQLLEQQENQAKLAKKRQHEYFESVVNEIKAMDNIRGVKIPEKDKKVLLEYIFKPTADGVTKFQKDWSKSVKNLLESAYFTMKGDTLLKAAKDEGSNKAISRFKASLSKTGISRKTIKQDNTSTESMWDSFARQLRVTKN